MSKVSSEKKASSASAKSGPFTIEEIDAFVGECIDAHDSFNAIEVKAKERGIPLSNLEEVCAAIVR